jgi:hypothetical protein
MRRRRKRCILFFIKSILSELRVRRDGVLPDLSLCFRRNAAGRRKGFEGRSPSPGLLALWRHWPSVHLRESSKTSIPRAIESGGFGGRLLTGTRSSVQREKILTKPTIDKTAPAISIQTALSVGVPVKKREISELKELMARAPSTKSTTPATKREIEII